MCDIPVVFCRSFDLKYDSLFKTNGFSNIYFCPILSFKAFPVIINDFAPKSWKDFEDYCVNFLSGVIFSSKEAVGSLATTFGQYDGKEDITCFVVGKKTKSLLESASKWTIFGEESGNASALGKLVAEYHYNNHLDKPWLFCCGNKRRCELIDQIQTAKIDVFESVVYETNIDVLGFKKHLNETLNKLPDTNKDLIFVYFSPSGVDGCLNVVLDATKDRSLLFVSIGQTTMSHLKEKLNGIEIYQKFSMISSNEPSPDGILNSIRQYYCVR